MDVETLSTSLKMELEEDIELPVRMEPATPGSEYAKVRAVVATFNRDQTMQDIGKWFHYILYKVETGEMLCFIPREMREPTGAIFFEVLVEEI